MFLRLVANDDEAPKYVSTRGGMEEMGFGDAVLQGLASDRGLMVPTFLPQFPESAPEMWRSLLHSVA
eukprot:1346147-Amorphochlora_amoeboformis.AAC.1